MCKGSENWGYDPHCTCSEHSLGNGRIMEVTFYQHLQEYFICLIWRDALKRSLEYKVEGKNGF